MSEPVSLEFIGAQLQAIQIEQRNLRTDNDIIRRDLANRATRDDLYNAMSALISRMGTFEADVSARLADISGRLQTEMGSLRAEVGSLRAEVRSLEDKVGSLEHQVGSLRSEFSSLRTDIANRFDALGSLIAALRNGS